MNQGNNVAADSKTMTYETTGKEMDGNPSRGKNALVDEGKNQRTMIMYMPMPEQDEMVKAMEIVDSRANSLFVDLPQTLCNFDYSQLK